MDEDELRNLGAQLSGLGGEEEVHSRDVVAPLWSSDGGERGGI